jgi:hypothetical protein
LCWYCGGVVSIIGGVVVDGIIDDNNDHIKLVNQ